jgi:Acyl carrier protein phosphodiesterase
MDRKELKIQMCNVLYIKANTHGLEEDAFALSDQFVDEYKRYHPDDQVTTLDLSKERIRSLNRNDILSAIVHKGSGNRNHPVLKYAWQFAEADKYIVAEPQCESGIPAILNYMDYVSIMDIAFKYTDYGPVGLLRGKKAVNILLYGEKSAKPVCFGEPDLDYLKSIFSFFGITDFTTIRPGRRNGKYEEAEQAKSF